MLAAEKITDTISYTIDETLYKNNYDVFSLGRYINLENHTFYNEMLQDSEKLRDVCIFSIETTVEIRRIGKIILDKD